MKAKTQGTCRRGQTLLDFWLRTKPLRIASRCHSVTPTPRAGISQAQNFHGCYYFLPTDPGLFTAWLWLAGHGHCQRSSMNQQIANQSSRKFLVAAMEQPNGHAESNHASHGCTIPSNKHVNFPPSIPSTCKIYLQQSHCFQKSTSFNRRPNHTFTLTISELSQAA